MPDKFLEVEIEISRKSLAAIDTPQLLYLLVGVKPAHSEKRKRIPLNLSLVIDRSTSMRGRRLASVRAAATKIVEKLTPVDHLSVVAFSDRATVIIPAGNVQEKAHMLGKIQQIDAFGGTEAFQGLQASYKELREVPLEDYNNHVILLTDGHTYGDADDCLDLVHEGARDGINLSAFGIGPDWNERFLDQLAAISGGETMYIASANQVVQALQQCIQGLGTVYAKNLRLVSNFPDDFKLVSAFRVAPSAQPLGVNGHSLRLGNVDGDVPLSFLLELTVEPQAAGTKLPLIIDMSADIPAESIAEHRIRARRDLEFVAGQPEEEPPETLVAAVQAWNFHRMNDNVWADIELGNLHRAKTRMQKLTRRLIEAGHTGLAQRLQAETERLATGAGVSPDGRKTLTFATRSMVTQMLHSRTIEDDSVS